MKRQTKEYIDDLRERWFRNNEEDQRFYIRYSAMALGLLLSLQAFETGRGVFFGPFPLWIAAVLAFLACLVANGPVCHYYDSRHYEELAESLSRSGEAQDNPDTSRALRAVNILGRIAFAIGCTATIAYFICQRFSAADRI